MRIFAILFLTIPMLLGCSKGTPAEPAKAATETPKDGGFKPKMGEVMTTEDMEKLAKERKEMIDRPSPLGGEIDASEAVRKQVMREK